MFSLVGLSNLIQCLQVRLEPTRVKHLKGLLQQHQLQRKSFIRPVPRQGRRRRFQDGRRRESVGHVEEGRQRLDGGCPQAVDV